MTEKRTCPRCGATLPSDLAPGAPCPRCLLNLGAQREATGAAAKRLPAPRIDELAPLFPGHEILALIGEGGMGAVYRARHKALDRDEAVKILLVRSEDGEEFDKRFEREARAMAALSHRNIAAVHDHGKAGRYSFLSMEFVDGSNLRQLLRSQTVAPREALAMVQQICDALQYAHEHGVVHRDTKPENILVDRRGTVKLVDFGLARLVQRAPGEATLTQSAQAMGTWHYMAPEQYERPREVDHRADIYSPGVVLYELLTGQVPVGRFAPPSAKVQVDVRVDEVVLRSLEREPEKRYQSAAAVKDDVRRAGEPGRGRPGESRMPVLLERRGGPWTWIGAGIGCALLALLLSFGCFGSV